MRKLEMFGGLPVVSALFLRCFDVVWIGQICVNLAADHGIYKAARVPLLEGVRNDQGPGLNRTPRPRQQSSGRLNPRFPMRKKLQQKNVSGKCKWNWQETDHDRISGKNGSLADNAVSSR
jgi:hypothetical protein